jgi:peptidyl-prolyl cis-trans isomerase SurA
MTVTDRIDDHKADFARDYLKIKDLALYDKQIKAIEKWQKEAILETYIKINGEYRDCDYQSNWLKTE